MVQSPGFVPGWTCYGIEAVEWRGGECPEVAENVEEISDSPQAVDLGSGHAAPDLLGARGSR